MSKRILLTGSQGLLGSAILRRGYEIVTVPSDIDLRYEAELVFEQYGFGYFDCCIHTAAVVKGIQGNRMYPATILEDNALINLNVAKSCVRYKVGQLVTFGSTCMYPANAAPPMSPDQIFNGPPEPTNFAYAMAKRLQSAHLRAMRDQYGFQSCEMILANLYGPGPVRDSNMAHVIPALIDKCLRVAYGLSDTVEIWGTGQSQREFLFVEDAADAIRKVIEMGLTGSYNIGSGESVTINELYRLIADIIGVRDDITVSYDTQKPDGQAVRLLNCDPIRAFWTPATSLQKGLELTIESYRNRR